MNFRICFPWTNRWAPAFLDTSRSAGGELTEKVKVTVMKTRDIEEYFHQIVDNFHKFHSTYFEHSLNWQCNWISTRKPAYKLFSKTQMTSIVWNLRDPYDPCGSCENFKMLRQATQFIYCTFHSYDNHVQSLVLPVCMNKFLQVDV